MKISNETIGSFHFYMNDPNSWLQFNIQFCKWYVQLLENSKLYLSCCVLTIICSKAEKQKSNWFFFFQHLYVNMYLRNTVWFVNTLESIYIHFFLTLLIFSLLNLFLKITQTCLIFDLLLNIGSSFRYLSAFSPPSPVLDLPPALFIAIANVEWASIDKLPKLIAPITK